jgi:peptidoglycan/LPS O-acetylase OafA/YrhL
MLNEWASSVAPDFAWRHHRFQTLDALRGIAAVVVVVFHNRVLFGWTPRHGYLAVDLFFMLSGFVLSHSYQGRLDAGLPTKTFLYARIVRLAPLYLLALTIGVFTTVVEGAGGWLHFTWKQHLLYIALGIFLLPSHYSGQRGMPLFPYNYPSWTLFLELLMNIIHAAFFRRLRTGLLLCICAISAFSLLMIFLGWRNLDGGWDWNTLFTIGISRAVFSYTLGMLLYRGWSKRRRFIKVPAPIVLLLAAAALVLPTPHPTAASLLLILVFIPAIIYLGAQVDPGNLLRRAFSSLGAASYAIYILQSPFFNFFHWVWPASSTHVPWSGCLMVATLIAVSWAVDLLFDRPVRMALRKQS